MKISKKILAGVFSFLCLSAFPLWPQQIDIIAPPAWIQGLWESADESGAVYTTQFTGDDIFFDADSAADYIEQGEITGFTQNLSDLYYEIYFEFSDGYWWKERFFKPDSDSLESSFENSDGDNSGIAYTRKKE
jgi:hypothetical protein